MHIHQKLMIAVLTLALIERRIIQPVTMVGLYSGQQEWTMNGSDRNLRYVFFVDTGGAIEWLWWSYMENAIRQTLLLSADISIAPGGQGTVSHPYIIQ